MSNDVSAVTSENIRASTCERKSKLEQELVCVSHGHCHVMSCHVMSCTLVC